VRGVAAMGVFLCHLQPIVLSILGLDPSIGSRIIGNSFRGVDLFFVLSGFILFQVHRHEFANIRHALLLKFYLLRFFRVYPLNTVVLVFMLPLPFLLPEFTAWYRTEHLSQGAYHANDFSIAAFVQGILLCQTWTGSKLGTWNEPAWTLSAEVLGYSIFPFLAMYVGRYNSAARSVLLAAFSLSAFIGLMVIAGHATNNPSGIFGIVRMFTCFFAGICLCQFFHLRVIAPSTAKLLTLLSTIEIFICLECDWLGTFTVLGFAGLILGLAFEGGAISSLMKSRPCMFLGRISFSFYIVHIIPLNLFAWIIGDRILGFSTDAKMIVIGGIIGTCISLAVLTYKFVEVPFQRLGRRTAARIRVNVGGEVPVTATAT
jgi:peptidoglycan/LPS O-acetylase OafA/YrhL